LPRDYRAEWAMRRMRARLFGAINDPPMMARDIRFTAPESGTLSVLIRSYLSSISDTIFPVSYDWPIRAGRLFSLWAGELLIGMAGTSRNRCYMAVRPRLAVNRRPWHSPIVLLSVSDRHFGKRFSDCRIRLAAGGSTASNADSANANDRADNLPLRF